MIPPLAGAYPWSLLQSDQPGAPDASSFFMQPYMSDHWEKSLIASAEAQNIILP